MPLTRERARSRAWYGPFLSALAVSANVTAAPRAARVKRTTPYQARQRDEQFAQDWDAALEEALDAIEETAMRLAA